MLNTATVIEKDGIRQYETEYKGWTLFAWEWCGSWRVTAETADIPNLRCGITWGGGDKVEMWDALDDAKKRIDSDDIKWTQWKRGPGGKLERVG